ncbi:MAG: 30S ribosomal protein S15 [Bacteroidales bacterium]|nr:30S ribosomal protein S15 [Bacteroidales bacterium]
MQLTAERKKEIFKQFGGNEANTGISEAQIALFSERITHLTEHLRSNKKDFGTQRSLMRLVGKRKKLLSFLKEEDISRYRNILKELNLRK